MINAPQRATCPVCGRDEIIVNRGTLLLRKHKPNVFRLRDADGMRQTTGWCEGSGRPV